MTARTLVIGGSGGIGSEVVRRFAPDGAVVFTYLKAVGSATRLVEALGAEGFDVEAHQLDVRDVDALEAIVGKAGPDIRTVVFAAASGVQRPLVDVRSKHCDWTYQTNQRAFILLYKFALASLRANRGSLVALTSVGSRRVLPDYALVGATKAALEAIVRYAACEAAPWGVRVNSVCPGLVETKALNSFPEINLRLRATMGATPLGRLVTPREVAETVHWISSDAAGMITGHNLVVDGGWEVGNAIGAAPPS